jgi:hypothetical protein
MTTGIASRPNFLLENPTDPQVLQLCNSIYTSPNSYEANVVGQAYATLAFASQKQKNYTDALKKYQTAQELFGTTMDLCSWIAKMRLKAQAAKPNAVNKERIYQRISEMYQSGIFGEKSKLVIKYANLALSSELKIQAQKDQFDAKASWEKGLEQGDYSKIQGEKRLLVNEIEMKDSDSDDELNSKKLKQ